MVVLLRSENAEFCPVRLLTDFIDFCSKNKIPLQGEFCFRSVDSSSSTVSLHNFSSSAANARLKFYLQKLDIFEGETPHSSRSGCALTLLWLGIEKSQVKSHVGWKSDKMFQKYTCATDLCNKKITAQALATSDQSNSEALIKEINKYKNFTSVGKIYD